MSKYYGLLGGVAYSLSFSIAGIFAANKIDKSNNRSKILGITCILWSLSSILTGSINSLLVLAVCRVMLGIAQSAAEPTMYSLMSDYFPAKRQASVNGALEAATYVGTACSSLFVLITAKYGWRMSYNIMGIAGVIIGMLTLAIVKEPKRKRVIVKAKK